MSCHQAGRRQSGRHAPGPMTAGQRRRIAAASVVGSVLEWYDFFLFGSSAALVFNKVFFTGESEFVATLASFATFAVGFAARPVGGLDPGPFRRQDRP